MKFSKLPVLDAKIVSGSLIVLAKIKRCWNSVTAAGESSDVRNTSAASIGVTSKSALMLSSVKVFASVKPIYPKMPFLSRYIEFVSGPRPTYDVLLISIDQILSDVS